MQDALRQVIRDADGAGELGDRATGRGSAEHPVCGDLVEVELRVADGRIEDLAWRATGCPATLAVAAAARAALCGARPDEVRDRLDRRIAGLGGLAAHERHALRLVVDAVGRAVREPD